MKLRKQKGALLIGIIFAMVVGLGATLTYGLSSKPSEYVQAAPAENPSVIDTSIFTFTISGEGECNVRLSDKTVQMAVVPQTTLIDGEEYTITSIASNGFANSTGLEKVWLPSTIKTIGTGAFINCKMLKYLTLSEVETIGANAFAMTNLEYLILPDTVKSVAATILRNCDTPIYIRATQDEVNNFNWHSDWNGYNTGTVEYASNFTPPIQYRYEEIQIPVELNSLGLYSAPKTIEGYVLESYQSFVTQDDVDIYVPAVHNGKPVIEIEDTAFWFNTMNSITVGYSDTPIRIGASAFYSFQGTSITINRDIEFIDDYGSPSESVFATSNVSSVILPDSITDLQNSAFQDCQNLKDIHFIEPKPLTQEEEHALASSIPSTQIVTLPKTVTTLGSEVFSGIKRIMEIHIPNSVVNVGESIFVGWNDPQVIYIHYANRDDLGNGWNPNWSNSCNLSIVHYDTIQEFDITYKLNGGTHDNPATFTPQDSFVLKDATRIGYTFDGWFDGNGKRIYEIKLGTSQDLFLEAKFTEISYIINYNPNKPSNASGNIVGATGPSFHEYDVKSNLAQNGYALEGWTFIGWKDASGNTYNDSADVNNWTSINGDTIELFAQWVANNYTITYVNNRPAEASSAVEGIMESSPHTYDTVSSIRLNQFMLTGWTFSGWKDAENNLYQDGQEIKTASKGGTLVLMAQWAKNQYTVIYDKNKPSNASNSITGVMANSDFAYDTISSLQPNAYALKGWIFKGWNTTSNGSGQAYSNNYQAILNMTTVPNSVIYLYAQWMPITYEVYYYPNGGSGIMEASTHTYDTYKKLNTNTFLRTGYHINEWNTKANGNGSAYSPIYNVRNLTDIDGATVSLYVQWNPNTYTIIYNANGGTGYVPSTEQVYDAPLNLTTQRFERYGYVFIGWSKTPNGSPLTWITTPGQPIIYNFVDSGSVTLYAVWKEFSYTVVTNGYCTVCEKDSFAFGVGKSKDLKIDETFTFTAPEKCGLKNGALTTCACKFSHWVISMGEGYDKNWSSTNRTLSIKNFTTANGDYIQFNAIYVDPGGCVADGTLVTLADGTQKPVEQLTGNEMLLVWNLYTGKFDVAPILFIDHDPSRMYEVINLYFSDGTELKVIYEHALWNFDLNKYVFIRNDANQYVGHWFNKQIFGADGQMSWSKVQLTNVVVHNEYTSAWSPVTAGHLCYYVNGMLSMPGATEGLINIFDVDADTMKINEAAYQADIEKYGLFTYEEFAEILPIPEEVFEAFGGKYLKVSIGKGLITYEELADLIQRYSKFF